MVDLLSKKRAGGGLSREEVRFFVEGYTAGTIPDYQAAAFTMAVCFAGMDHRETADLTLAMACSGDQVDLSGIPGVKVDKHSTGGVGDKTTLIVGPMVASLGLPVAKMSGRGLGHTGGTIDKLESIPGLRTSLSREEFLDAVARAGISVAGQTGNLAPADKKLYALRDVTATVDSIPLIASSVMSKKIAAGADAIVLDVKVGSGAFMGTVTEARALAEEMVGIGESVGRSTLALITDMDIPLGRCVGNALEVREAVETLRGEGPRDLTDLCVELAGSMLLLGGKGDLEACRAMARESLRNGTALAKFRELVAVQGGDVRCIDDLSLLPRASIVRRLVADRGGFITHMDAQAIGLASMQLGAGRETKDSQIDPGAGIVLLHRTGDRVERGEVIAELHTGDEARVAVAGNTLKSATTIGDDPPSGRRLILDRIGGGDKTRRKPRASVEQKD